MGEGAVHSLLFLFLNNRNKSREEEAEEKEEGKRCSAFPCYFSLS